MDDSENFIGPIDPKILARIDSPPKGGDGFNQWLLHAANHLCNGGVPEDQARAYLFAQQMQARGHREDREVERVLELAYHPTEPRKERGSRAKSTKVSAGQTEPPEPDECGNLARPKEKVDLAMQAAAIAAERTTASAWLSRFPDELLFIDAREALRQLMGGDPKALVCVGRTVKTAITLPLEQAMKDAENCAFIVPSPMTAPTGINKKGRPSRRCYDNTGPRWYLVIESDTLKSKDDQASVLMFLGRFAPLCAIVDSAGKSLQGCFYCFGQSERDLWQFMRVAVLLGADPVPWSRCQMVRMPEGLRNNGKRQSLLYFDRSKIGSEAWDFKGLLKWERKHRTPPPDVPSPLPRGVEVYYDKNRQFLFDNGRDFVPMDRTSLAKQLKQRGIETIDETICKIQTERFVKYCGPLAGRDRGLVSYNGNLLLATTNPQVIPAKQGKWPTIDAFLRNLLCRDELGDEQLNAFMGWMKTARMAMLARKRRPGQGLIVAGPIQCGKTLLIKLIIIPAMGGRAAKPYKYLSGRTPFNLDLIGPEVLVIDDEQASTRLEARRALAEGIKLALFPASVQVEGKHKDAFTFDPLWRVVIAVNDDPESLRILPPLSEDLSDKLMILKCWKAIELSDDEFERWQAAIAAELPAFLADVEAFDIAPENADGRCGVASFLHPDIVAAISELDPERQLLSMIDALADAGEIELPWEGTAIELKGKLDLSLVIRDSAFALLGKWVAATGVYLGKLVGERVEKLKLLNGDQRWRIKPPSGEVDTI